MSVIQIVLQVFARVNDAVSLAVQIVTTLITSGWYVVVRDAATVTNDIHNLLEDPTCGQSAQCAKLDTLLSDVATLVADVSALGSPQQAGSAVTLPTTPPAGYGGLSSSATGLAVWTYAIPGHSNNAAFYLVNAGLDAVNRGTANVGFKSPTTPGWLVYGPWTTDNGPDNPTSDIPSLDPRTILPTDADIAAWINRVQPGYSAFLGSDGWANINGSNAFDYVYDLSPWDFEVIRANNAPASWGGGGAPLWPGLAGVTLLSAHAMAAPGEAITIDCDGLIIDITGVPSWAGSFSFGTAISWRNVGAVSFTDDNGEQEFPQTLGFAHCVYLPKSMMHATGYAYRVATGVSGTLTPFVIN